MSHLHVVAETALSRSARARQLEALFDVPASEKVTLEWDGDVPLDEREWQLGLIVGPSGAGKSTILRSLFGDEAPLAWNGDAVIDDFAKGPSIHEIAGVCQAVGFNTIPAWLRPYRVLSNGERFRVELARRLLEGGELVVVDEFTSVVDRQVAQIGAHAVQKYIRKQPGRRFVAASCHYDILDWLQPDWVLEPSTMSFTWRSLQRRPPIAVSISRVPYAAWRVFAPFHYLTAALNQSARCYALSVDERLAAFAGILHRPHPNKKAANIKGVSRLVTLPDWQGLGLAMVLVDQLGAAHKTLGWRLHTYPAHPALMRTFAKSPHWRMVTKPGGAIGSPSAGGKGIPKGSFGGRPNATFEYCGPNISDDDARALLGDAVGDSLSA